MEISLIVMLMFGSFGLGWVWCRGWYKLQVENLKKRHQIELATAIDWVVRGIDDQPIPKTAGQEKHDF